MPGAGATSNGVDVAPDLNFIPSALVKRVDILTGGASATYGADAMAGVVNLILDKDFEGFKGGVSRFRLPAQQRQPDRAGHQRGAWLLLPER